MKNTRAIKDLIVIFVAAVVLFILASALNLFYKMAEVSHRFGTSMAEEVFAILIFLAVAFGIFSWRRWSELQKETKERKKIESDLRRAKELSDALNEINKDIGLPLDFDKIMQCITVDAAKAMNSEALEILLYENGHWVVRYLYGLPESILGTKFAKREVILSEAIPREVLVVNDACNDRRINREVMERFGVRSILIVPMVVREEVIGYIAFSYHSIIREFTPAERDFANKLGALLRLTLENNRLCEERKKWMDELKRSNKELEQFAYIASHDLQQPLQVMLLAIEFLEKQYKGKVDKDTDKFIGYILEGIGRMQQLIDDLLKYSRAGTVQESFKPVNLEEIFDQIVATFKLLIEQEKAIVTHDPLPTIMGSDSQMTQLFQNLLSNALKFRKPDESPLIHVTVEKRENEWLFSFSDNGIGMSEDFEKRAFQIFQREHSISKYPGTGIGLATVRRIVERHGGKIWVESELGKGTTFYFTISRKIEHKTKA